MRIVAAILLLSGVGLFRLAVAMDMPVRTSTREDGTRVALYLPDDKIARAPKLDPEASPPPLAISEAVAAAKSWAATEYHQCDKVEVRHIETNDLGFRRKGGWYYIIELVGYVKGMPLFGGDLYAAVLMDGTVVAPKVEQ